MNNNLKVLIGFVFIWCVFLLIVIETRMPLLRVLLPIMTIGFLVYLAVVTFMFLFSSSVGTAIQKDEKDKEVIETAEVIDDDEEEKQQ